MRNFQKLLLDSLQRHHWSLGEIRKPEHWWAADIWAISSSRQQFGLRLFVTFMVDPGSGHSGDLAAVRCGDGFWLFSLYAVLQAFHLWPIQVNESFQMLSLDDIRHLDAAEGWLERRQYANCFEELERIECNERADGRVLAVRWKLYNQSGHHLSAANLAAGIQWHFPNEITGYVWHAASLTKPGCAQEAYDTFDAIVGKFDSPGAVPCVLRETSINRQISGY